MVKANTQSVNEEIFDRLTRHQIGLTRLAAGTSEYLTGVLNRFDPKIAGILKDLNASTTKRQLDKALNEFRKVNIDAYLKVEREMKKALTSMSYAEAEHQKTVLKQSTPAEAFRQMKPKTPSKKALREMVESQPYNGALLEEHINGLEQGRYSRVRDVLRREVSAGGTDAAVQDAIMKGVMGTKAANYKDGMLDYSRRSLDQKTRTLHNGVAQETRSEFYEQNDEIFDGVLWVSVLDNVTSAICQSLDGTVFPVDEGERPPAHPNCRSEVVPIVKDWEAMGLSDLGPGTRESMTGEVPETQTYNEWLGNQPREIQDEILGPNRGQLFRDGLSVDSFVDDTGRKYTLDELFQEHKGEQYWRGGLSTDPDLVKQWAKDSPLQTFAEVMTAAPGNQKRLADAMEGIAKQQGLKFKDPGVKTDVDRIKQKLGRKAPAELNDLVRGGVEVQNPAQVDAMLDELRKEFQVMDEGWQPTPAGYFDRKAAVRMRDGQVAELQFWEPALLKAKMEGGGHDLYVAWRKVDASSPEAKELEQQMRDLYGPIREGLSPEWKAAIPDQVL